MKKALVFLAVALSFGLASLEADAAKRFGGGSSIGKQRAAPTMKEAPKAAPAQPSQAAPAATPATPAAPPAKPSFMSRWGGLLAGLGIGALLGSLFNGLGGFGTLLVALLAGLVIFAVVRMLLARKASAAGPVRLAGAGADAPAPGPVRFEGIGSRVPGSESQPPSSGAPLGTEESGAPAVAATLPPGFEKEPFLRVAKTSFIRLQAANDAKDLDDIRDYTTPEMFAELSMQIRERGDEPQKTEVVSVEAQLVEAVVEDGYEIVSVRFYGLIREDASVNPAPFDEVWHVRKKSGDRKATWLIAGIQQLA